MKILKETYEIAIAAAGESEVPLLLAGDKGIITDIVVVSSCYSADYAMTRLRYILPAGMHRYGKVITKNDRRPGAGCNLVEKDGRWQFADEDGGEIPVEILQETPPDLRADNTEII